MRFNVPTLSPKRGTIKYGIKTEDNVFESVDLINVVASGKGCRESA